MTKDVLVLVALAADEERDRLTGRLEALGFRVETVDHAEWIKQPERPCLAEVLLLGESAPLARVHLMTPERRVPRLVLLGAGRVHEGGAVSVLGDELAVWPCGDAELALRMDRLLQMPRGRAVSHGRPRQNDPFLDLNLVGAAPVFKRMLDMVVKVSRFDVPVVIEGETGTGKEVVARAVHYLGPRRGRPFVPVNCGALPDNLIENELFGHARGAYTDAKDDHVGLVDLAEHGTLFLDEIETLSEKAQATLLRFLQEKEFKPLGARASKKSDVRVIAASNVVLDDLVAAGRFRRDLFFRLNVVNIGVPPLRTREGDIGVLADHFMCKYRAEYGEPKRFLSPEAIGWMNRYRWPGNVRELENLIHRAFVMAETDSVDVSPNGQEAQERRRSLADRRHALAFDLGFGEAKAQYLEEFERRYLFWLMEQTDGNVTQAARRAGKERRALGRLLKKHGLARDVTLN